MVVLLPYELHALAGHINTGTIAPDTSRALVVFNLTDNTLSGVAVFRAGMAWSANTPLPPVVVRDLDGAPVPSVVTDWHEAPDRKGRPEKRQIAFALRFAVRDVPARGWRTYIAAYASAPESTPLDAADETPGLMVVETLRHDGDLPPVGIIGHPNPLPSEGEGGEPRRAG